MSRIAFFGFIAHGHTNPTLEVVRELTAMGHEVRYYSFTPFKEAVTAAGAEFICCDSYLSHIDKNTLRAPLIGNDIEYSIRLLTETALALDPMIMSSLKEYGPCCAVADSMAIWGRKAALSLGIPLVTSVTTFAFNKYSSKIMKSSVKDAFNLLGAFFKTRACIKRLRQIGYNVKGLIDLITADESIPAVVYTSPLFQPCSETFPESFLFAGPSIRKSDTETVKTCSRLVYISMGTVNNNMAELYRDCIETFGKTDYQVIIAAGNSVSIDALGPIPENISVVPSADQISVLKKADVFISHCGMNSVSESLYFGVPLVMLPVTNEQQGVANRVSDFKAGIRPEGADGASLLKAVCEVIKNPIYRENAKMLSDDFRGCPGPRGAAEKIASLCKK